MLTINNTLDGYLKDIEILGNTIQDASNLADIRSVGDKVEGQELYEIPVLSVGKNLFNPFSDDYVYSLTNGIAKVEHTTNEDGSITILSKGAYDWGFTEYKNVTVPKNVTMSIIPNGVVTKGNVSVWLFESNGTKICEGANTKITFTSTTGKINVRLYVQTTTSYSDAKITYKPCLIEEGTVATPYEPYQEDKLTILSPTPLEKVGNVADRIIEKDGVWGVEKWTTVKQIPNNLYWIADSYDTETSNTFWCHATGLGAFVGRKRNEKSLYHKKLNSITRDEFELSDTLGISTIENGNGFIIRTPKDVTVDMVNDYISENGREIVCTNNTPTFIPLPHDQQVKLRTFANKTNISFLTEIEGTIKAQVPKSLGATVNTHTEQISNLNKELDRVKKLEESTVSTVETESDFTTVEATTNGYFEDVKLEGKTLVNLLKQEGSWTVGGNTTCHCFYELLKPLEVGKTYTYFYFNLPNTITQSYLGTASGDIILVFWGAIQKAHSFIATEERATLTSVVPHFKTNGTNTLTTSEIENIKVVLLEGDHTQNPPSYFEGLKSVGEDTDEIVVSSTNSVLEGIIFNKEDAHGYVVSINPIHFGKFYVYTPFDKYIILCVVNNNGEWIRDIRVEGMSCTEVNLNDNEYIKFIIFRKPSWQSSYDYVSLAKQIIINENHVKQDKKRLLYYNDETQTWEKPILRQWDSIEKHADGKYYYHQRSGEVVLNGSENWALGVESQFTDTHMYFSCNSFDSIIKDSSLISDKFENKPTWDILSRECIDSVTSNNKLRIRLAKSKLSTQDVQGFKQWLQTNNVTVVYQLAQEKVYECTNIDLLTYANETNYIVESGVIVPKTTLKVHNNISNVVSLLQKKVSLLESNITSYIITQNRLQLASTYSADSVTFKVDYFAKKSVSSYDNDLFNLILSNILVGKENYDYDKMFNIIMDYASWSQISWDQFDILVEMMDLQHNPPIELPTEEFPEETPEE